MSCYASTVYNVALACNFSCLVETERFLKITMTHMVNAQCVHNEWLDALFPFLVMFGLTHGFTNER